MGFTASINHKSQKGSAAFHMFYFSVRSCAYAGSAIPVEYVQDFWALHPQFSKL